MISQNQSKEQNFNQNVPQQASHSVFLNDQLRATLDRSKKYPFSQQNKNMTNKHHKRNQPHYSEDEDYYSQNQQQFSTNQHNNNWNIDQPDSFYQADLFEPYTGNEQTRQTKHNTTSYNSKFQSQNPINTQNYQPTQMQNEIPLPNCLQQHELAKTQLENFSQIPNAAESLQMTMNPYLMGGSSISSNKPLMILTRTDPEYSVEDYLILSRRLYLDPEFSVED